jgi:hypothetical protein
MVEAEIRKAWQVKHPPRDRHDDVERPRRRASRVQKIHNASGIPDLLVEGRAARLLRDPVSNVERPSSSFGFDERGESFSADLED